MGELGTSDRGYAPSGLANPSVVEGVRARLIESQALNAIPRFEDATFLCSVKGARITPGGDLDITLAVPPSQKYSAMPLTDAVGIQVLVRAQRKRRTSTFTLGHQPGEPDDQEIA